MAKRKVKTRRAGESGDPAYDAVRAAQARIARERSARGRDFKRVPDIADIERRERCRHSCKLFCDTYNPTAFALPWSSSQIEEIERIEDAARHGALYAFASPRGDGKTTRVRMATLWAISYALCRYVFVIGATNPKATDTLDAIRTYIRFLPLYAVDFPEISYPARKIAGIAQRAGGQTCNGAPTMVEWAGDRIVLPTVPPPKNWPSHWPLRSDGMVPTSGAIISASGLTGEGIRGSLLTLTTGESVRPDLVLLDDPQTSESARSPTQNANRLKLISGDVLGMAGPDRPLSAVMPCTCIEPGDMVDQVLDREKHPLWRGTRTKMLKSMPTNMEAWDSYFEIYQRCARLDPPDFTEANAAYEAERKILDAGAEATWEARKLPHEISAIQHAMHLYYRSPRAWRAEYQNDPDKGDLGADVKELVPAAVASRLTGLDRYIVPREAAYLTVGIDPGKWLHWYCVVAWNEAFGGATVDYGTWPRQARGMFEARDARPNLRSVYPNLNDQQLVFAGLRDLCAELLDRRFFREDGTEAVIDRVLIDAGNETKAVEQFIRQSPHRGITFASKGIGRSATSVGVSNWTPRPGERRGHYWRLTVADGGRTCQFDTDEWKSLVFGRLTVPPGGRNWLGFWGKSAETHALISEHLAAEYATPVALPTKGLVFDKWVQRPHRPDNHWFDTLVLSAVAASVAGCVFTAATNASGQPVPVEKKGGPRIKLSELLAKKRRERAGAR